jgi:IclR family pca regulon transcriptional regulator
LALPALQRLFRAVEESVLLSILSDDQAADIVSLRRPGLLTGLGKRFPLYCTPGGKVLLAYLPLEQKTALLDKLELVQHAPNTLTSRNSLEAELLRARKDGFAIVNEEFLPGVCGAAAPILDRSGTCIAVVAISASMSRVSIDNLRSEILPKVLQTAEAITERLRWYRQSTQLSAT